MQMRLGNMARYGSHLPVLIKLVGMTDGPVLELGMGFNSSPFLHWSCVPHNREIVSYDADAVYFRFLRVTNFGYGSHKVVLVDKWEDAPIERPWDVVFIDVSPDEMRGECARRVANYAKFVVLHDTEPEAVEKCGYDKIFPLFKYRFDYKVRKPYTSVLSNFVDVRELKI
jgi:hypothetical protein